jgi:pimeloyl-ACP methyl ester carboxylesterase
VGDRELPRAEDRLAPDRPVTREWGDPAARPIVFWPGLNPWGDLQLVEVGPLLAERGFHVIAFAPPWREGPDFYLPSRLARYVIETVKAERFAFMGHSWGATIGVHLAADHPENVDALVLLDAGHTDVEPIDSRDELVLEFESDQEAFAFDSWDAYFDWVRTTRVRDWRPSLEPRYREAMIEENGRIVPRANPRAAAWALYGVAVEPPSAELARITAPVLLIVASNNEDAEALERFKQAQPGARVEVVDSGHDIPEDAPDETARLVAEFLG